MKEIFREKIGYLKYSVFHPFDGFYEIRFRGKGSGSLAAFLLFLFGVMTCVSYQYTGFIMNENDIESMNSISLFATAVLGFVLFIFSNWSVTTLLNGKGNLKDILIVCGYSLLPVLLTLLLKVLVCNVIIEEEVMILNVASGIGIVWFLFMMISGLCVIHEYTFGKNIAALLLTFVAAVIILFLGILFFTLVEQMVNFIISVGRELVRRM